MEVLCQSCPVLCLVKVIHISSSCRRLFAVVAVISHAFKTNHNSVGIDLFWENIFSCTTFAFVLYILSIFFYLYCNTFDGSSIIIFIMHAIELSFHDIEWFPFHHWLRSHCILVIIVSNVTTIDIFLSLSWHLPQILWTVCRRHPCADRFISIYCVGQVRYYSAILEGS